MKRISALLAAVILISLTAFAQSPDISSSYFFTTQPVTNFAGVVMAARPVVATYSDTSRTIAVRGLAAVGYELASATNDSGTVLLQYQTYQDSTVVNPDGFVTGDSLQVKNVGSIKYGALPNAAIYSGNIRFRTYVPIWDSTAVSHNPLTTFTLKVFKIPYNKYYTK